MLSQKLAGTARHTGWGVGPGWAVREGRRGGAHCGGLSSVPPSLGSFSWANAEPDVGCSAQRPHTRAPPRGQWGRAAESTAPHAERGRLFEPHAVTEDGGPSCEGSGALSRLGRGEGGILHARKVLSVG